MNEDGTYTIPDENLAGLQAKIAKLAKRADKLGVPAPTCTVVETFDEEITESVDGPYGSHGGFRPTGLFARKHLVAVTGEAPRYAGWALTAVIEMDHEEGRADGGPGEPSANVVGVVPDAAEADVHVDVWRTLDERCDHCGVNNRNRSKLVVVTHEDGTQKIVGSTCLKDFLGHTSPDAIASWAQWLADLDDVVSEYEESFNGGEIRYDPEVVLAYTRRAIKAHGWTPRSAAQFGQNATADHVFDLLHPGKGDTRPEEVTAAERAEAAELMAWAQGLSLDNDYLANLQAVASKLSVRRKHLGILVSLPAAYDRAQGREIERKAKAETAAASKHFGTVGERLDIEGTVTFTREFPGYAYNSPPKALVKILTTEGNVATWWCSNASKAPKMGDKVAGKATVKEHDTYEGSEQTVVTRAKLTVTGAAA